MKPILIIRTEQTTHQNQFSFSIFLLNEQEGFDKTKEIVEKARTMKAMNYTMPDIFEATGLQPEIIQSL